MSSSDQKTGTLVVTAPDALISVYDAAFRPVPEARSVGLLSVQLPPGPYRVSASVGATEASKTAVVRPERQTTVKLDVQFESAAPAKGIRSTWESHSNLTVEACELVAGAKGPDSGLVIVLRDTSEAGVTGSMIRDIVLRDQRRRPVAARRGKWRETMAKDRPAAAWSARLRPGGYTLALPGASGKAVAEQSVWLPEGWLTVMFLPVGSSGPQQAMASVHLVALNAAHWDPASSETLVSEMLLTSLRDGKPVLGPDTISRLKDNHYRNPMFAILAAYALINSSVFTSKLFTTVVQDLEEKLGQHPDVLALRACSKLLEHDAPAVSAPWPPMLAASYRCLLDADRINPSVLPAGSTSERIAAAQLASGPWLQWAAMGDPKRRGKDAAADVLFDHLNATASRLEISWHESASTLGTPELARRLAMPESLVKDGLRTLRARRRD